MSAEAWSDTENNTIVASYFAMLAAELVGSRYNKAENNRKLQDRLPNRSRGSIEFKHQNISAVLLGLGQPWIIGYKPASQFQLSLVDAVIRCLEQQKFTWNNIETSTSTSSRSPKSFRDPATLWVGPPPTHSNKPSPIDTERMAMIARRYDVADRDAQNKTLGANGEAFILDYERFLLRNQGRPDLADQVVWTSKEEGDGAGYDIRSYDLDGTDKLIEVKTTNGWERTPFHISRNEIAVADRNRDTWHLMRLWNFAREPKAFSIRPPLQDHIELTPTSFLASLN